VSQLGHEGGYRLSDLHTVGSWQPETLPISIDSRVSARMPVVRFLISCARMKHDHWMAPQALPLGCMATPHLGLDEFSLRTSCNGEASLRVLLLSRHALTQYSWRRPQCTATTSDWTANGLHS